MSYQLESMSQPGAVVRDLILVKSQGGVPCAVPQSGGVANMVTSRNGKMLVSSIGCGILAGDDMKSLQENQHPRWALISLEDAKKLV